ncbi:MAG: glycine cleavage system protein GcvH [Acidimicrobiales bacterium]|jgi:glycine cleavage system H protein|nr:glycine cleavage system protein GcvH [Acidimicrobiales bacterium]
MNIPDNLLYSADHEWVRIEGNKAIIGVTDYAQDALGDVVYVDIPNVGANASSGDTVSEVESTKSVSDIFAPLTGTIVEVNQDLANAPELLNVDPYGEGWICVIEFSGASLIEGLLTPEQYREVIEN